MGGEGLEEGDQVGRVLAQLEVDLLITANPVSENIESIHVKRKKINQRGEA